MWSTPTPPLNITMVKLKDGSRQRGHVRYPSTKYTLKIKWGKRENLMGKTPPQGTMYVKKRTTISRQLCPSLQDGFAKNQTSVEWRSWWRCLPFVLLKDITVGLWSPHVLSPICSACGYWCASSATSEMDLYRTSECFGCHTRWQLADETECPTRWENVVAT